MLNRRKKVVDFVNHRIIFDAERRLCSFVEHRIIKCQNCDFNPIIWRLNIRHIDVDAGFQSSKSTIAETGMGVTSRP